jgi:hypothetical protein
MLALIRTLHVLSVALWFGTVAFFTIAGLLLFDAFREVSEKPAGERPLWLPVPAAFEKDLADPAFPRPIRLEQGSRAAGAAVSKIFPVYFLLQAVCAALAVLTAVLLLRHSHLWLGRLRLVVCFLGLASVLAGWWLEHVVSDLRVPRNERMDALLTATDASAELVQQARAARAAFGMWHGVSLLVNFATLGLALAAVCLAAHLPTGRTETRPGAA